MEAVKTKTPKKFFIDRTDPKSNAHRVRSIVNENEVKDFLIKKDFTYVRLHDLTFLEQVKHFNNAECIIGLHGGGFANISFCKSNIMTIKTIGLNCFIRNGHPESIKLLSDFYDEFSFL